jgi:hypothetical protein
MHEADDAYDSFKVPGRELTVAENAAVAAEIAPIVDVFVSTKWDVELAARIEAAQAVVTGAVQVIEEAPPLRRTRLRHWK